MSVHMDLEVNDRSMKLDVSSLHCPVCDMSKCFSPSTEGERYLIETIYIHVICHRLTGTDITGVRKVSSGKIPCENVRALRAMTSASIQTRSFLLTCEGTICMSNFGWINRPSWLLKWSSWIESNYKDIGDTHITYPENRPYFLLSPLRYLIKFNE